ncbi:MAG: Flp pilus assembly protein CpaB [Bdellovibrionota bacterium]
MKPLNNMHQNDSNVGRLILIIALVVMLLLGGFLLLFFSAKNKVEKQSSFEVTQKTKGANGELENELIRFENVDGKNVEKIYQVLMAARDIKSGERLSPAMFRKEPRPSSVLLGGEFKDFSELQGLYAKEDISASDTIDASKVTNKKPVNTITANIPEGYRAVTINVDVTSSVEGWARAGAFVDVVWNSVLQGKPSATVIVQNAKILSAERVVEGNTQEGQVSQAQVPSTVTLLVLADDATKIHLAATTGKLSLQLRGDDTDEKRDANRSSLTIDDLLGGGKTARGKKRYDAIVKIRGSNGKMEKWGLKDGVLVPVEE